MALSSRRAARYRCRSKDLHSRKRLRRIPAPDERQRRLPITPEEKFRTAMHDAGLHHDGPISADGKLHRFKADGDKERNSWYLLYPGLRAAGAFGCWKRGFKKTWCDNSVRLSPQEWDSVRAKWA